MFAYPRRSTPEVRSGKVQRKNRWAQTPNCYNTVPAAPVIDRQRPGLFCRHLVRKHDLRRFIALVPNWQDLSVGLRVLILARGDETCMGWHRPGLVAICAWEREIVLSGCADGF